MSSIRRDLAIPPGLKIRYILRDILRCRNSGTKYDGKQKEGAGRVPTLSTDSVEAQIVADELEGGASQHIAWGAVNVYRESLLLDEVTFSAVYTLIQNMKPKSVSIDTHRQGSNNELSRICRARKAWCTQLCVRLGLVDYREVMRKDGIADAVPIPKWYDPEKLTSIKIDQIAFWDETQESETWKSPELTNLKTSYKNVNQNRGIVIRTKKFYQSYPNNSIFDELRNLIA